MSQAYTVMQNSLVYVRVGSCLCPTLYFYPNCVSGRWNKLLYVQYESKSFPPIFTEKIFKDFLLPRHSFWRLQTKILGEGLERHHVAIWVSPNLSEWVKYPVCSNQPPFLPYQPQIVAFGNSLRTSDGGKKPRV